MSKKEIILLSVIGLLLITILIPFFFSPINNNEFNPDNNKPPIASANLEGIENILIFDSTRTAKLNGYGLVTFEDTFTVLNQNNNPINSIFMGISIKNSDNLIFFEAKGINDNALLVDRSSLIMNNYEMIAIYFNSPLLPQQETTIEVIHSYQNLLTYNIIGSDHHIDFFGSIFPIFPYKAEGNIKATFIPPNIEMEINFDKIGEMGFLGGLGVVYDIADDLTISYIDPFLGNFNEDQKEININSIDVGIVNQFTKLEMEELNREIFISPWGLIKVKEEYSIQNKGILSIAKFPLKYPKAAKNLYVFDELGELLGASISGQSDVENYNQLMIDLARNRAILTPNSKFRFIVEYNLPFEKYSSFNWLEESIQIDIFTSINDYLGKNQIIKIIIEGCNNIEHVTTTPNAIEESNGAKILVYKFTNVSPFDRKILQFVYTIDLFDLLLRPMIIMLIVAIISSIYVLITKIKGGEDQLTLFKKESIPVNEVREFCSLYEEMNALILEIRKTEDDAKHKKVVKKQYTNIKSKNSSKIEQIKQEIIPFKQTLIKTNETFENIVKKLDLLDAERDSVNDSLNLLESRYKRGKLPSKAAYQKLSTDFMNRRKKIDRTIDKFIQQLRSYII
ncbi:MAG: hypothetical protein ACFFFY_03510 [Promethearchaeota archaeon]